MIIAVVCDVLGEENNGTTVAAMNLIRYLKSRGHEVRVLCPDADKKDLPGYYIVPMFNAGPFRKYIEKNGVSLSWPAKAVIASALGGVDAIHIMVPFFLGHAALKYAIAHNIPVTAGFHCQAENITNHLFLMDNAPVNRLTYRLMNRYFYRNVCAIHYPTQFIRNIFEENVGPTNGYVISNGVHSDFRPRRRITGAGRSQTISGVAASDNVAASNALAVSDTVAVSDDVAAFGHDRPASDTSITIGNSRIILDVSDTANDAISTPGSRPFVILFTGRYSREKSHRILIDAVSLLKDKMDIQLIFAGTGPLEKSLREYSSRKLTIQPVMKFFSREEMIDVINSADLYVHPAQIEIESIACLEAISCGLVPVISDSPRSAARYFALDEKNLFRYDDPSDLAARIEYWANNPDEMRKCSLRYAGFAEQFAQEQCMKRMEEMIISTAEKYDRQR